VKLILPGLLVILAIVTYFSFSIFSAPEDASKEEVFVIDSEDTDALSLSLEDKGFIKSFVAFNLALKLKGINSIESGGYYLSKDMSSWEIINNIKRGPKLKWVLVPEGIRKEQIGERLQKTLGWDEEELKKWNEVYTTSDPDFIEGVYFPDNYLIPIDEPGDEIAKRMIRNFNDKVGPYFDDFEKQNTKWTTAIKIASIIEREAAGPSDMPLIAGVLWNRLLANQKLDIDATIQYAAGKRDGNWWSRVTGEDIRTINSPYNTYKFSGLPPTPISNPGLTSILAVLNPEETDCFYYLHDSSREIHCSKTYEEHMEKIDIYLN
jgi:UPF0755 protein